MRSALSAALSLAALLVACGGGSADGGVTPATSAATVEPVGGALTVFAAASLTEAFEAMATTFGESNPEVDLAFNFANSAQLATQITEGGPADVFASAGTPQMQRVTEAGLVAGEPQTFASNLLEIAVEPGNPLGISGLADLAAADVVVVLVDESAPAGQYAAEALDVAGIDVTPASFEATVNSAVSKVALGEADAAIVYRSDIVAAGEQVEGVAIPEEANVAATYPIATLAGAPNPQAAAAFVALVQSDEGHAVLQESGFVAP